MQFAARRLGRGRLHWRYHRRARVAIREK